MFFEELCCKIDNNDDIVSNDSNSFDWLDFLLKVNNKRVFWILGG